jgi:hypothetical protein
MPAAQTVAGASQFSGECCATTELDQRKRAVSGVFSESKRDDRDQ